METQLAVRPKASHQLATLTGMEPGMMLETIKAQCFKCNPANVSDAQLAAFVSIAAEMGVNPLLPGMLYAYPVSGGGIVPMMGPDAVFKKLTEHPEVDSWETTVYPEDPTQAPTHSVCQIWRKGREHPLKYMAVLSEWKIGSNPNWNSRPRHMLSIRALKQCARQIIHGIPFDEDERVIMGEINVTPSNDPRAEQQEQPAVQRKDPPARSKKGVAAIVENKPVEKAIDVPATLVQEKIPVVDPILQDDPPDQASAEAPKPVEKPVTVSRAFLKDGEEVTVICTVGEVAPIIANLKDKGPTPSVQASVKGEFVGTVFHFGGATSEGDKIIPNPLWKTGNVVQLSLLGRLNNKSGKVLPRVEKLSEAPAESLPMDVE